MLYDSKRKLVVYRVPREAMVVRRKKGCYALEESSIVGLKSEVHKYLAEGFAVQLKGDVEQWTLVDRGGNLICSSERQNV